MRQRRRFCLILLISVAPGGRRSAAGAQILPYLANFSSPAQAGKSKIGNPAGDIMPAAFLPTAGSVRRIQPAAIDKPSPKELYFYMYAALLHKCVTL